MHILLVDDHQILCVALSEHLERTASHLSDKPISVKAAFQLSDAINAAQSPDRPDIVFLDLGLDGYNCGISTIERFQENNPYDVPVAIFTGMSIDNDENIDVIRRCLRDYNARGVLLKNQSVDNMFIGISRIISGELWVPQDLLMALATTTPRAPTSHHHLGLSPREWEIANLLTRGLQNKQIARDLNLSHHYVRQVTTQIYEKLDVSTRMQAAEIIRQHRQGGP